MIPLWIKLAYTALALVIAVVYWRRYGPGNFLWFSDIALFGTVPALWLESGLLASMMALAALLPDSVWNISYFGRLITGKRIYGLTDYMFERERPRWLRALSLFHVVLPLMLLWMVARLGYRPMALPLQSLLSCVVLALSYCLTDPAENINRVFGPGNGRQQRLHPLLYLALLMLGFPLLVYLPTHLLLSWLLT